MKNGSSVILNTAYAYRDVSWNRGSAQVEFRNVRLGSDSGMLLEGKKYVYDDVGNLKEIRESTGDFNKLVEYAYDSQNQLVKESYYKSRKRKSRMIVYDYSYDTAGNLLTRHPERMRYHMLHPDLYLRRRAVARPADGRQRAGDHLRCLGQPAVLRRLELRLAERKTAENGIQNL